MSLSFAIRNSKFAILFLFLLLFFPFLLQAQPWSQDIPRYDFVRQDLNRLQFPGDSSNWEAVWRKMDELVFEGKGQVQFMQMGGSHVQAGTWSHQVRGRMQTLAPGCKGGLGFVFPYRMAGTNGPWNYAVEYEGEWAPAKIVGREEHPNTGLAGYSVSTTDSLTRLRIWGREDSGPSYDFNRVKVFHSTGVDVNAVHWRNADEVTKMVTYPELGMTEIHLARYHDTLDLHFLRQDSLMRGITLYGISLETDDPGILYHAVGVNGASVPSWLKSDLFQKQLGALKPDVVVLSIGINDANTTDFSPAAYERNYDSLISRILSVNPKAALLFTTNTDSYYKRKYPNKNADKVRESMLRLAKKYNGAVWDTYGVMGGLGSVKKWQAAGLAQSDRVHMTPDGYRLLGDLLSSALQRSYEEHVARRYAGK
jgi:lysophospholipase L1-like esterase